jgi:hypothetical protein
LIGLLYVAPSSGEVGGLRLARGTRTVASFWPVRPFSVYYWQTLEGGSLDLLVSPGGVATWIDEEEAAGLSADDRELAYRDRIGSRT